jgi:hypothetical protein
MAATESFEGRLDTLEDEIRMLLLLLRVRKGGVEAARAMAPDDRQQALAYLATHRESEGAPGRQLREHLEKATRKYARPAEIAEVCS